MPTSTPTALFPGQREPALGPGRLLARTGLLEPSGPPGSGPPLPRPAAPAMAPAVLSLAGNGGLCPITGDREGDATETPPVHAQSARAGCPAGADALAHRTVSTVCRKKQKAALISARKDVCFFFFPKAERQRLRSRGVTTQACGDGRALCQSPAAGPPRCQDTRNTPAVSSAKEGHDRGDMSSRPRDGSQQ